MSQVFDPKELLERVDNDWDFLADTIQMLNSDGRGLMDEIRNHLAAADAPALGRAAHTLKGMISNFCAPSTQAAAFEVEKIGKSGDLLPAPAPLENLSTHLDALIGALNDFLTTRS